MNGGGGESALVWARVFVCSGTSFDGIHLQENTWWEWEWEWDNPLESVIDFIKSQVDDAADGGGVLVTHC
ncbi:hypothetical protein V6N11_066097 [Hibiscus sabdariffa]|uniref:Uncharacterized protein n=1 Tax=Hibiscus sabdariffa TaxID=183260 RepID=A0ABR2NUS1_9ROSI